MIDFRYHLVSLVSVFIALAIGVVLGAGPLRGPLGDTLTTQVEALRSDKANLQQAVTNRENEIATQNTAIQNLGRQSVAGTLTGRRVLQVVLPGADPSKLAGYADLLEASGAEPSGTVTLTPAWSDPAQAQARTTALAALADVRTTVGVPADADEQRALATLLAAATLSATPQAPGHPSGQKILDELSAAKLISVTGDDLQPADLVVIVAAGPTTGAASDDAAWQDAEKASGATLATTLRSGSAGTVVSGPASSAAGTGLLGELRVTPGITTVDGTNSAAALGVVLGLLQQSNGGSGHYGSGSGATSGLPPLPTPGRSPAESTSSGSP